MTEPQVPTQAELLARWREVSQRMLAEPKTPRSSSGISDSKRRLSTMRRKPMSGIQ